VAINNSSLPGNLAKLLYVVRARREFLDKYTALSELVNSTLSWRRGKYVEALVVDKSASSNLLSKLVKREDVEIRLPGLLVGAGVGVEPIREFDLDSPTLGIRELSGEELERLLREVGLLRVEEASKQVASAGEVALKEPGGVSKSALRELSDEKLSELEGLVAPILGRVRRKSDVLRLVADGLVERWYRQCLLLDCLRGLLRGLVAMSALRTLCD